MTSSLPTLQNLIRRDPTSYKDDFAVQYEYLKSKITLFFVSPSSELNEEISELIMFVSHVLKCYPTYHEEFPKMLEDLIRKHNSILPSELRVVICKSLIILRNRDLYQPVLLMKLFFELLGCPDKALREMLKLHIITDIRNINLKNSNNKMNRAIQAFIHTMLFKASPVAAKIAIQIMIELYRKHVWNDAKTVNIIADACLSTHNKIMVAALTFFLSNDPSQNKEDDGNSSEEEEKKDKAKKISGMVRAAGFTKKAKNKMKKLERARLILRKEVKKKRSPEGSFLAVHLLNDPQTFAEKLYKELGRLNDKFEIKLMVMQLIARVVGIHQLFLFNFYPYLQKYLSHSQVHCTKILAAAAQASHPLVPPDVIEPLLKHIANTFISDHQAVEVMAVGINSVREICVRCPLAMDKDLLQDLAQYKKHTDKGVSMAARSLISLFRTLNRSMLAKVDQGKPGENIGDVGPTEYGASKPLEAIPGIEFLNSSDEEEDEGGCCGEDKQGCCGENGEKETAEPGTKRKRLSSTSCCGSSGKRRRSASETSGGCSGSKRHRTTSETSGSSRKRKRTTSSSRSRKNSTSRRRTFSETSGTSSKVKKTAQEWMTDKILTEEDFQRIEEKRLAWLMQGKQQKKGKRQASPERADDHGDILNPSNIEHINKHKKQTKEERLETIRKGRPDKKFGIKKAKMDPNASSTNAEKRKNKPFMMVVHKRGIRERSRKSFAEKQRDLKKKLLRAGKI